MTNTKTQYDTPDTFNTENLLTNIHNKWVVEVRQHIAKNTIRTHLHYGRTPFHDTRTEARRVARAIRANYGWKTRVRRYSATK